jgi:hypothetical protein
MTYKTARTTQEDRGQQQYFDDDFAVAEEGSESDVSRKVSTETRSNRSDDDDDLSAASPSNSSYQESNSTTHQIDDDDNEASTSSLAEFTTLGNETIGLLSLDSVATAFVTDLDAEIMNAYGPPPPPPPPSPSENQYRDEGVYRKNEGNKPFPLTLLSVDGEVGLEVQEEFAISFNQHSPGNSVLVAASIDAAFGGGGLGGEVGFSSDDDSERLLVGLDGVHGPVESRVSNGVRDIEEAVGQDVEKGAREEVGASTSSSTKKHRRTAVLFGGACEVTVSGSGSSGDFPQLVNNLSNVASQTPRRPSQQPQGQRLFWGCIKLLTVAAFVVTFWQAIQYIRRHYDVEFE